MAPCGTARVPVPVPSPVPQLADAGPDLLTGGAQQLEDVQQLLQLRVAREERLLQADSKQCDEPGFCIKASGGAER
jgi:hypothetical protein